MAPSFSILFPIPSTNFSDEEISDNYSTITCSSPTSSTSSVDCTLSLGTPSTRQNDGLWYKQSSSPAMYWDIFSEPKKNGTSGCNAALKGSNSNSSLGGDPLLLARRCANCDTTSTPLWRNGPRGPKSLCNACGIRYKKEERRAATNTATIPVDHGTACGYQQAQPWTFYGSTKSGHMSFYGHDTSDNAEMASYLPWRFSAVPVQQRTTLYQYN